MQSTYSSILLLVMTVTFGVAAQTNCPSTQPRAVCASKKDYNNPNTPVVQCMCPLTSPSINQMYPKHPCSPIFDSTHDLNVAAMIKIEGVPCRDLTAQFDLSVPRCCKAEVAVGPNGQPATGGAFIVIKRGSIVYGTLDKPLNDLKQDCVLPIAP
ncbi:hypothetical protein PSTT_04232 [Puccinia striiformis]|uniref:Hydrophobin n=1 Tax=Puccinia striiformis TaxID=27350 RepID=A0A2S4VSX3_9BASI|nr:hypothetical protein PSTT_04232 [Puccinia striiformis]